MILTMIITIINSSNTTTTANTNKTNDHKHTHKENKIDVGALVQKEPEFAVSEDLTPSSHHNFCLTISFPRVGLPRNLFLIGSLTAALIFSKGWVRKYLNLVMGTGCTRKRLNT